MRPNRKTRRSLQAAAQRSELALTGTAELQLTASDGQPARQATFSMMLYSGGVMQLGWGRPVVMDLGGLKAAEPIAVLLNHDRSQIVGQSTRVQIDAAGVRVEGVVTGNAEDPASPAGMVVSHGRNGFRWPVSNGTSVEKVEAIDKGQSVTVNGREFAGPLYVVRAGTLREGSFVSIGADASASAQLAAAAAGDMTMTEFEKWLTAHGHDPLTVSDEQKTTLQAQFDAEKAKPPVPPLAPTKPEKSAAEVRAEAVLESNRCDAIRKLCGGRHADIEAKAISGGWQPIQAECEVLRAERPKAPDVHSRSQAPLNADVLEAAAVLSSPDNGEIVKMYDEKVLEAASKRSREGLGLGELIIEAAYANGYTGRGTKVTEDVLRFAFVKAEGGTTMDISGILSNIANKYLLQGFFSVEKVWRQICAVRSVRDFKAVTSFRLTGTDQYQPVAPGGQLKHGTLGNETYTNKADTYGLMLGIDRRDLINDDMNAISTVPQKLGRGSGLKINDVFWTVFMNNAAFFTAGNKNYLSGATTNLSIDGLTAVEQAFMDQVDTDGKPIAVAPKTLLLPTALSALGKQLYTATEIRDTTASTKYPTANPHSGQYTPLVSRYLSNTKYTGYSAKAFYLLADPMDLAVIEVAFLNGQEAPVIETAAAEFGTLGIQMRGYHDFGVSLQDPRAAIKSKGEA